MLFNSYSFMLFFPIVLLLYIIIPKRQRYILLLIASYIFYMCWNVKYVVLILISTVITWLSGIMIEAKGEQCKKCVVIVSLVSNLAILFFFKYFNFFLENMNHVLNIVGISAIDKSFDIVLPVGISFYTFQALSYTMDVFYGKIKAEKNFFKYALFVSFFPQLVAGPIERSKSLLNQINHLDSVILWDFGRIAYGAGLMLWGYFLKMVIADRLAILVDNVWENYYMYGSTALILASVFFAIQIYCDFNSYSIIAMGTAKILGVDLMENFNTPYFSVSIKDFWHRWHISLSAWFRDYLYIPLGGSRCSKARKYFNLSLTFLVSGLWHGASWNYIVWGGIHGFYQIIGECKKKYIDLLNEKIHSKVDSAGYRIGQAVVTFGLTTFAWIFFRSKSLREAFLFIQRMFVKWDLWTISQQTYFDWGLNQTEFTIAVMAVAVLLIADLIQYKTGKDIIQVLILQPVWFRWGVYFALFCSVFIFGVYGPNVDSTQFIYFQF